MKKWGKYLLVFLVVFVIYKFFTFGRTETHDVFIPLANSLLKGRLDIVSIDPTVTEIVHWKGRLYFCNGPGIVLLTAPYVLVSAVLGHTPNLIEWAIWLGAANAVLIWMILESLNIKRLNRWLLFGLFVFGTTIFHTTVAVNSWFFSHIAAAFFSFGGMLALIKKKYIWMALLVGLGVTCRPSIMAGLLPLGIYVHREMLREKMKPRYFWITLGSILTLIPIYNYLRFGSIWETGYSQINGLFWPDWPQFALKYIPGNLYFLFLKGFELKDSFPYLYAPLEGQSILFVSPALLLLFKMRLNRRNVSLISFCLIGLMGMLVYLTNGLTHFGYRYTTDLLPYLLIPLSSGFEGIRSKLMKILLVFLSVVFLTFGVVQWNYWGN